MGSISLILGVGLYLVIPEVKADRAKEVDDSPEDDERDANKKIGFLNVFKVCFSILYKVVKNFYFYRAKLLYVFFFLFSALPSFFLFWTIL